jgi:hypothetical protein
VRVYVILDKRSSATNPLGEAIETFIRREDAERFIEEVRGDDPELASYLRIEERELERVRVSLRSRRFAVLFSADLIVSTAQGTNMAQEQPSQLGVEFVAGFSVCVLCCNDDHDHDQRVQGCQDADTKSDVDPHAPHILPTAADGGVCRPDRSSSRLKLPATSRSSQATCGSRSRSWRRAGRTSAGQSGP